MIEYILTDANGAVFQRGHCNSEAEIPQLAGMRHELVRPDDLRRPPAPAAPTYRDFRAMEMPPIGDQLDALWKAFDSGDMTEALAMRARIMAVKEKHPKG